jgi:sugar diacid utilization regulator
MHKEANMKKEELISFVLDNDDLDPITSACAEYLSCPLVVIAKSLAIISYSSSLIIPDFPWQNAVKRGYITLEFGTALNNWEYLRDQNSPMDCITVNQISQYRRRFYKLTYHGRFVGYLNIGELKGSLDDIKAEDINLVRSIIAKEVSMRRKFIKSTGTEEEVLISLINYEYVDRLHYLEMVKGTSFAKENDYRIACINIHHQGSYNAGEDTLKEKLQEFFPDSCIVVFDEIMTIAFTQTDSILEDTQKMKKLTDFLTKVRMPLAYSEIFHDMFQAPAYKAQAMFALEHRPDQRIIIDYGEVQLLDLLYQVDRNKLSNYCSPEIIAVHQYDEEHHSEYLKTIRAFIAEGGSSKMTASSLNVHRNTLHYRLEQIEHLFQIDLSYTKMWTQYQISCDIMHILNH